MKTLKEHIIEGLKIGANTKVNIHKYHPKNKDEFFGLVEDLIKKRGNDADLNDIDTSQITNMSFLFTYKRIKFNGNISKWDVSNVTDMSYMFMDSEFTGENGDISDWDVSNVKNMNNMFAYSKFKGDISKWDVRNVKYMSGIFNDSPLKKNPPKWYKE